MAIKDKQRRDTYRSNVKVRPLRQNGLEAQNQGQDIREINIDHSGLPIIGRGGFQNRQRYTKAQKEYIVDVSEETYFPSVVIEFTPSTTTNPTTGEIEYTWNAFRGLQSEYHGKKITLRSAGTATDNPQKTYVFNTKFAKGHISVASISGLSTEVLELNSTKFKTENTNGAVPKFTFNGSSTDTAFDATTGVANINLATENSTYLVAVAIVTVINNSMNYYAFNHGSNVYITAKSTVGDYDLTITTDGPSYFNNLAVEPENNKNTGDLLSGATVVDITENSIEKNSLRDLWTELIAAIESSNGHGQGVFTFGFGPIDLTLATAISAPAVPLSSSSQRVNSLKISLTTENIGDTNVAAVSISNATDSPPIFSLSSRSRMDTYPNGLGGSTGTPSNFTNIQGNREWALNGYKELGMTRVDSSGNASATGRYLARRQEILPLYADYDQDGVEEFPDGMPVAGSLMRSRPYYEDIRTDHLQTAVFHGRKHPEFSQTETFDGSGNTLTYPRWGAASQRYKTNWLNQTAGTTIINVDNVLSSSAGSGTASVDPTHSNFSMGQTQLSEEVKIRSLPLWDEIPESYRVDHKWSEDIYWTDVNERTWTNVQSRFSLWHASFIEHIAGTHHESNPGMIDGVYHPIEDIPLAPMTGRIDLGLRVSRTVYGLISSLPTERHPFSFYNQYLEERRDPINIQENRFPVQDRTERDLAWDDNIGRRFEDGWTGVLSGQNDGDNAIMFNNYYDELPIDTHDYLDSPVYYSSIDEQIQQVMSDKEWDNDNDPSTAKIPTNRSLLIDRREWQDPQHVITATGFINSQSTRQSGIVYRELLR